MIEIDASYGEGGGQILRTSLTLAALTGQAVRLTGIRAGRSKPGLAPQHLTAVRAAARVCAAEVRGDKLRSTQLMFAPGAPPMASDLTIDVTDAAEGGSAGAVTLILQTVLLPLAAAHGASRLRLRGGTHVPHSPSFHYLAHVYVPLMERLGLTVSVDLKAWGFYPAGGGEMTAAVGGRAFPLAPLSLVGRGALRRVWGLAVAANLPAHIPQRIASRAANVLAGAGIKADVRPTRERSAGPGAGLFLFADYGDSMAGFSSLGSKGKPSEQVAEEASLDLIANHASGEPVDMHLADQLLLPLALAPGRSEYHTCRVTRHLLTNAYVIQHFLPARIEIEGEEDEAGRVVVEGVGVAN